jgi:hypothetical protein
MRASHHTSKKAHAARTAARSQRQANAKTKLDAKIEKRRQEEWANAVARQRATTNKRSRNKVAV